MSVNSDERGCARRLYQLGSCETTNRLTRIETGILPGIGQVWRDSCYRLEKYASLEGYPSTTILLDCWIIISKDILLVKSHQNIEERLRGTYLLS